jgi:hypothetical protein
MLNMDAPPVAPMAMPALSPEQLLELARARQNMKRIRRAVFMSKLDGWTLAVFGSLTILFGLMSLAGWLVGGALVIVAIVELRAGDRLAKLDPTAPKTLAFNQLFLGGVLAAYAIWNLVSPPQLSKEFLQQAGDLKSAGIDVQEMTRSISQMIYATLLGVAVLGMGLMALFYWRRKAQVETYLAQTPPWILTMQRAGFSF